MLEDVAPVVSVVGLIEDPGAPMFFWPSRLDPNQKGCQLLAEILYAVVSDFWDQALQIVFVANGEYQRVFRDIVSFHNLQQRVAVCDFNERLEHQAYGASDGRPPEIVDEAEVAHDTGGLHDTISHLDIGRNTGNGFVFETYDAAGLWWAIHEAMHFFGQPVEVKTAQIERIMHESTQAFTHAVTARQQAGQRR